MRKKNLPVHRTVSKNSPLGFCFRGLIPRGSKPEGNIKRRLITIAGVNYRKKHFRGRETII